MPNFFDPEFRNPRALQFKVGIERELAQGIIAGADFTYINTTQSTFQRDTNLGTATEDATGRPVFARSRPNPDFFIMQMTDSSARSLYRALTYTLNLRRSSFALDAAYTLSWKHSHDDIEQDYSIISYDNVNDLSNEYNYSLTDQRISSWLTGAITCRGVSMWQRRLDCRRLDRLTL